MTSIVPISDRDETVHDLIPAGMVKASDSLAIIDPKYSSIGESFRRNTPNEVQCTVFCGGRRCKYESANSWDKKDMAIQGIYSHWITADIVAMSRPNTSQIKSQNLIGEFNKAGIKSIINLQIPGEHASCGPRLETSGFTYEPNDFMKNKIFFYNYMWKDFGESTMPNLLDMVKVLSFALTEGKVAVHCHAGLGRTGVLLACYLVYSLRVRSNDAIRYVRLKRPNSVQTRHQIASVKEFETFFLPKCLEYSLKPPSDKDKKTGRFTLDTYLKRQRFVVHGYEARALKHIPKVMYVICERIVRLCNQGGRALNAREGDFTTGFIIYRLSSGGDNKDERLFDKAKDQTKYPQRPVLSAEDGLKSLPNITNISTGSSPPTSETNSCSSDMSRVDDKGLDEILGDGISGQTLAENKVTKELEAHLGLQNVALKEKLPIYTSEFVHKGLLEHHMELPQVKNYQHDLNFKMSAWDKLATETSPKVLIALLYEWLEHLRSPAVDKDSITFIVILSDKIEKAFKRLPPNQGYLLEYFIRFVARIQPLQRTQVENLLKRLVASLTHQSIPVQGVLQPVGRHFPKMRGGTLSTILKFMMSVYDIIVQENSGSVPGQKTGQKVPEIFQGFHPIDLTNGHAL